MILPGGQISADWPSSPTLPWSPGRTPTTFSWLHKLKRLALPVAWTWLGRDGLAKGMRGLSTTWLLQTLSHVNSLSTWIIRHWQIHEWYRYMIKYKIYTKQRTRVITHFRWVWSHFTAIYIYIYTLFCLLVNLMTYLVRWVVCAALNN